MHRKTVHLQRRFEGPRRVRVAEPGAELHARARLRVAPVVAQPEFELRRERGAVGARRTLQALKDDARMVGLVFRRAGADELPALGEAAAAQLDRCEAACRGRRGGGLWLAHAVASPVSPPEPRSGLQLPE